MSACYSVPMRDVDAQLVKLISKELAGARADLQRYAVARGRRRAITDSIRRRLVKVEADVKSLK